MPPPHNNHTLISFFTRIEQKLGSFSAPPWKTYSNLTLKEKTALSNLENNRWIIIKPCDKDVGICIMNTRECLTKSHTHLQDWNTYKLLTHNRKNAITYDVCTLIHYLHTQCITDTTNMDFFLPPRNTHAPLFYGLTKIHKPNCPLHPMVSGYGCTTNRLSPYITHFIQSLVNSLSLHIKDTEHFLNFIKNFHHSQTMHSWSQLMLSSCTQTFHMMMVNKPSFISWINTSISYPQTAHLTIYFTEFSFSYLNIIPLWTHTSTKSLAPPWE